MADADSGILRAHEATHIVAGTDEFLSTDLLDAVVRRLRTTTGPADLLAGAIVDGEFLKRVGTTIVSAAVTGNPKAVTVVVHPTLGVGDYQTIAAALADPTLVASGGTVAVREGTYTIAATLTPPNNPVRIVGMGSSTVIDMTTSTITAFTFSNGHRYSVENLKISGSGTVIAQSFATVAHASADVSLVGVTTGTALNNGIVFSAAGVGRIIDSDLRLVNNASVGINGGGVAGTLYITRSRVAATASTYGDLLNTTALRLQMTDSYLGLGFSTATIGSLYVKNSSLAGYTSAQTVAGGTIIDGWIDASADLMSWTFTGTAYISNVSAYVSLTLNGAGSSVRGLKGPTYAFVVVGAANCHVSDSVLSDPGIGIPLDIASAGTYCAVSNIQVRGAPVTAGIRTASTDGVFTGLTIDISSAVPSFLETGSADRNRITGCVRLNDASGPTIIGADTVVEGVRRKAAVAVATANTLTNVLTHTNQKGLTATEGTIINKHASASLTIRETVTDFVGPTTETRDTDVVAGANLRLSPYGRLVAGGLLYYAFGPFKTYSVEVRSTVTNVPATYDLQCASIGAE